MNYSKGDVILLPYPFTNLTTTKVRPAIVVNSCQNKYTDIFVVPITSKTGNLDTGEFILTDWQSIGLNVVSAVKRGCVLVETSLIKQKVGNLSENDIKELNNSLKIWFEID